MWEENFGSFFDSRPELCGMQTSKKRIQSIHNHLFAVQQHQQSIYLSTEMAAANDEGSTLSCHCLNTTIGKPASNLLVQLDRYAEKNSSWERLGSASTNNDGRITSPMWLNDSKVQPGVYRYTKKIFVVGFGNLLSIVCGQKSYIPSERIFRINRSDRLLVPTGHD